MQFEIDRHQTDKEQQPHHERGVQHKHRVIHPGPLHRHQPLLGRDSQANLEVIQAVDGWLGQKQLMRPAAIDGQERPDLRLLHERPLDPLVPGFVDRRLGHVGHGPLGFVGRSVDFQILVGHRLQQRDRAVLPPGQFALKFHEEAQQLGGDFLKLSPFRGLTDRPHIPQLGFGMHVNIIASEGNESCSAEGRIRDIGHGMDAPVFQIRDRARQFHAQEQSPAR